MILFCAKKISNRENKFLSEFEKELKEHKKNLKKLRKETTRNLSRLEKSEFILDYTHNFSSSHMLYEGLTDWIKNMNFEERMWYVINSCNSNKPTIQETFLLALAYSNLGTLYNKYAIYYLELYLKSNKFYYKNFNDCNTEADIMNYQWCMFHNKLACKYRDDLDYEKALKHAFMSKGMNEHFTKIHDAYGLIADIFYRMGDYRSAINNLQEGIKKTKNNYSKKLYIEQLKKYEEYKSKNKIYIQKNIKRLRINFETGQIYNLTTGEILE